MHADYIVKNIDTSAGQELFYFRSGELRFLPELEPKVFLDSIATDGQNPMKVDNYREFCLNQLQDNFHHLLRKYLKVKEDQALKVIRQELAWHRIWLGELTKLGLSKQAKSGITPSEKVSEAYRDLEDVKAWLNPQVNTKISNIGGGINPNANIQDRRWQYRTLNFLGRFARARLAGDLILFLVHGSFATRDFLANWSDLDTMLILKSEVLLEPAKLVNFKNKILPLSNLFYKIDPLAHHQFTFLTEFDLQYYPNYLFPESLYDYSWLLSGAAQIELKLRPDREERIHTAFKFIQYFRKIVTNSTYSWEKYHWKNDLSFMMMWPSFLLQIEGRYVYKKESFNLAKEVFPNIDWSSVDSASEIMRSWRRMNWLRFWPNFLFLSSWYWLTDKIVRLYLRITRKKRLNQSEAEIRDLSHKFLTMAESSLLSLLRNNEEI